MHSLTDGNGGSYMSRRRLLNPRTLFPIIAALLLVIAVACGSDTTDTSKPQAAPKAAEKAAPKAAPKAAAKATAVPSGAVPTAVPARVTSEQATQAPVVATTGKYGGTVRMSAYADTKDWDPRGSSSLSSIQAVSQLYNQLVQMDTTDTSQIVCDLCDSWEITNGGETFTFTIRDGIKWIDGTDLTGADIHNSMLRYGDLDGPTGRSGLWRNYVLEAKNGGVNLIDDKTIEFNLQFASGAFMRFLAVDYVKTLPKSALDAGLDLNLAETIIDNKLGSGPFVLDEYQRGNFYKVSKNENYFKEGRPFFDGIDHFIITDTGTLLAQFKAGQLDMSNGGFTNLAPTQAFELEKDTGGDYRPVPVSPSADWGLMLNVKKAPFNDARVREAIQLAIDYQQWNDLVFDNTSGVGCPLMGMAHSFEECLTWPGLRPKDGPGGAEDIAKAKALMAEAGYPDGFTTRYDVRQVGTYPDQCTVVKENLKTVLGIDGEMTTYPSAAGYAFFGTSRAEDSDGDWEMACQGEGQVVLDVDGIMGGVYLKGATRNYTDWSNDKVDAWFDAQKQEPDPAKRVEINKEMETFLFTQEDNHWITLGWGILQWIIGPDIRGFNAPETVQTHFKHEDLWLDY
ncbi:MAG: ABC transporter substrate-binding protein [SAR202 cluster bacterium]|nr:ABC transporter substrate-binding protein [SAR202 cluster bacterium]